MKQVMGRRDEKIGRMESWMIGTVEEWNCGGIDSCNYTREMKLAKHMHDGTDRRGDD